MSAKFHNSHNFGEDNNSTSYLFLSTLIQEGILRVLLTEAHAYKEESFNFSFNVILSPALINVEGILCFLPFNKK